MAEELLTQRRLIGLGKSDDEMPFTKIDAFFQECPWVGKIVSRNNVRQVHVRRIDASLLLYKPEMRWLIDTDENETIFLLDEKGELLEFSSPVFRKKHWLYGEPIHVKDKTVKGKINSESSIQEQLRQMPSWMRKKVKYLLSYLFHTRAVILYKIPENISLSDWFEKETEKEKVSFREQLEDIG